MMARLIRYFLVAALVSLSGCAAPPGAGGNALLTEEFRVASDPGIQIYVRNKRPANMTGFSSAKTVLYVHGATYPASTAFDLRLDGLSWMDYIAQQGYDVYLLDIRGYGQSTRPPQMERAADLSAPFAGTEEAMRDVDAVVEFIRKRRGVEKVNLLAWSWGTAIMQWYTSMNSQKVDKLVLYAPVWLRQGGARRRPRNRVAPAPRPSQPATPVQQPPPAQGGWVVPSSGSANTGFPVAAPPPPLAVSKPPAPAQSGWVAPADTPMAVSQRAFAWSIRTER